MAGLKAPVEHPLSTCLLSIRQNFGDLEISRTFPNGMDWPAGQVQLRLAPAGPPWPITGPLGWHHHILCHVTHYASLVTLLAPAAVTIIVVVTATTDSLVSHPLSLQPSPICCHRHPPAVALAPPLHYVPRDSSPPSSSLPAVPIAGLTIIYRHSRSTPTIAAPPAFYCDHGEHLSPPCRRSEIWRFVDMVGLVITESVYIFSLSVRFSPHHPPVIQSITFALFHLASTYRIVTQPAGATCTSSMCVHHSAPCTVALSATTCATRQGMVPPYNFVHAHRFLPFLSMHPRRTVTDCDMFNRWREESV